MAGTYPFSQLLLLLDALKFELKAAKLWGDKTLSAAALQSRLPFCCDTLTFAQWLPFVFIERLTTLANTHQPVPNNIAVTPMAESTLDYTSQVKVIDVIADIDELLSGKLVDCSWQRGETMTEKKPLS